MCFHPQPAPTDSGPLRLLPCALCSKRSQEREAVPIFRKFNPRKFDPATGKAAGKGSSPFGRPTTVPFSKFLLTAVLLHQAYKFVRTRWLKPKRKPEEEEEEWEEEEDPAALAAEARIQAVRAAA